MGAFGVTLIISAIGVHSIFVAILYVEKRWNHADSVLAERIQYRPLNFKPIYGRIYDRW